MYNVYDVLLPYTIHAILLTLNEFEQAWLCEINIEVDIN